VTWIFTEESDAETMRGGRGGAGGGVLGLKMQLDRMGLRANSDGIDSEQPAMHSSYFADMQRLQQARAGASALQAHPALSRSASSGAAMSVPSLSFPALNQQQQQQQPGSAPASLPVRLPGTQFVV
jgi:hypothetical protein